MVSKSLTVHLLLAVFLAFHRGVFGQSVEATPDVSENVTLREEGSFKRSPNEVGYFFLPDGHSFEDDEEKIAGGSYARDGEFPFMAVVHRLIGNDRIAQCGGTIIAKRWVLTAGHCIAKRPRRFFVVFGVINKSGIGYDFNTGPGVSMMTTAGALHPQYQKTVNDIGLLYMPRDIPFSSTIQPIRLAGANYDSYSFSDRNAYIIGWGKDRQYGNAIKNLKYSRIPIISNSECSRYWNAFDKNICTAPRAGTNTCQGDSGGPLTVVENGQHLQVGIVSYGDGRCPSSKPAVYTRITAYTKWIYDVTGIRF